MIIVIASKNKTKLNATRKAFVKIFNLKEKLKIKSIEPKTRIKQPIGEKLTIRLAKNRVESVKKVYKKADFWIGIEGGIIPKNKDLFAQTWVVIINRDGKKSITGGPLLPLPSIYLNKKLTLSEAIKKLEKNYSFKSKGGTSGRLTNGLITREDDIIISLIYAMVKFIHSKIY